MHFGFEDDQKDDRLDPQQLSLPHRVIKREKAEKEKQ